MGSVGANRIIVNTSEARRMSKEEAQSLLTYKVDHNDIGVNPPTKYANELFRYYYRISREHVNEGHDIGDGWGGGFYINQETDPALSQRAAKGVEYLIQKEQNTIEMDVRLGVFSVDEGNRRLEALNMVEKSLWRAVKLHRENGSWRRS